MNTQDLRYIKTERMLRDAFCRLNAKRKKYTLAQLCQEALINKTTFYKHYETLEDFEYKIRKEYLKKLLSQCEYINDAFTDTINFASSLKNLMEENIQTIEIMFSNNTYQINQILEEIYLEIYSGRLTTKEEKLKLIFVVRGSASILSNNLDSDTYKYVIKLVETVLKLDVNIN